MKTMTPTRRGFLQGAVAAGATLASPGILRLSAAAKTLNLYTARHYDTDEALYQNFTKKTGIAIKRIEANADAMIQRMISEGRNSPCDVFITVDAGRLVRAEEAGLLQPLTSAKLTKAIPQHLRDPKGHWFGLSKRARLIICNRAAIKKGDVARYEDLADSKWKGKVLVRSSANIYNQSLTGSMLAALGEPKTEVWCRGLVANLARPPKGGDTDQIRACAAGEGTVAVANSYYFGKLLASSKPADKEVVSKVYAVFPNQTDRGTHVNISGGGIAKHAPHPAEAQAFLEYLVEEQAQRYFAEGNSEYPVVDGVETASAIMSLGAFKEDKLNARTFAANNRRALEIMDRAGWK